MFTILDALSRLRRYYIGKKHFPRRRWRCRILDVINHFFVRSPFLSAITNSAVQNDAAIRNFPCDYFYFVSSDEVGRCLSLYIYLSISGEKNISAWQEERCGMTDYVLYILYFYSDANLRNRHHCTLVGCRSPYHHICFHLQVNNEFFKNLLRIYLHVVGWIISIRFLLMNFNIYHQIITPL